jgi:hypothetical protein
MTEDDIGECARELIRRHGHNAAIEANVEAVNAMARSDENAYSFWMRVKKLIDSINRIGPEARVH